jgi:hypothetical protein
MIDSILEVLLSEKHLRLIKTTVGCDYSVVGYDTVVFQKRLDKIAAYEALERKSHETNSLAFERMSSDRWNPVN